MGEKDKRPFILGLVILVLIAGLILAIVHSNKSKNPTATVPSASQQLVDKQQIKNNWQQFFAASTSLATRESLLQNGTKFVQQLQSEFNSLGSESSSAVVNSIKFVNNTKATVDYTVDLNKQPVLTDQTGTAVLQNNKWLVSSATLCQLLNMAGLNPAVCQGS